MHKMDNIANKRFEAQMKELKKTFSNGERVVLFVGAGQNAGHNVRLLWGQLIETVSRYSFCNLLNEMDINSIDYHAIMKNLGLEAMNNPKDELNLELYNYIKDNLPVEIQVSMIKELMKDNYIEALQDHLYTECNYDIIRHSFSSLYSNRKQCPEDFRHLSSLDKDDSEKELYTLFIIARMILLNPQIEKVITYNFDNFIRKAIKVLLKTPEAYFNNYEIDFINQRFFFKRSSVVSQYLYEKVNVVDVHDNNVNIPGTLTTNSIPIYHVHGYIPDPNEETINECPNIVMALEEFVEQQTSGLSWQDAVQIDAFRNAHIVFIGCSMTDLTMKRMINFAHSHGYRNKIYILDATIPLINNGMDRDKEGTFRQKNILSQLRARYFESLGATYINCPNGFISLCDSLYGISYLN